MELIDGRVPEEIRDFVYCASARYSLASAQELLNQFVDLSFDLFNEATEINRLINGMGCSGNEAFIKRFEAQPLPFENILIIFNVQLTAF